MDSIKVEEAKKELKDIVQYAKSDAQKAIEAKMSEAEKRALEEKQRKDKESQDAKEVVKKVDETILAKKDEERTAEEKERAKVLLEEMRIKEESRLSADEKIKRVQESSQRRIDEIVNELKQLQNKSSKEAEDLKKEMQLLKTENERLSKQISSPEKENDISSVLRNKEQERLIKYLEEDGSLPRESRREMPDEEIEEWLMEDQISAQRWIAKQELRRFRERTQDEQTIKQTMFVQDFQAKMQESNKRVLIKHPELDTSKRERELIEQGKPNSEIQKILCEENEKYRIASQVMFEKPDYYLTKENGPELVAAEMEKRFAGKSVNTEPTEIEKKIAELEKKNEEQAARIAELEADVGIGPSHQEERKRNEEKLTEEEDKIRETMLASGATDTMIKNAIEKHRIKKGKR